MAFESWDIKLLANSSARARQTFLLTGTEFFKLILKNRSKSGKNSIKCPDVCPVFFCCKCRNFRYVPTSRADKNFSRGPTQQWQVWKTSAWIRAFEWYDLYPTTTHSDVFFLSLFKKRPLEAPFGFQFSFNEKFCICPQSFLFFLGKFVRNWIFVRIVVVFL